MLFKPRSEYSASKNLICLKLLPIYIDQIENYNNTKWLSSQFVDNKDVHDKKKYKIPSIPMPYKKEKLKKVKSSVIKFTSATSQSQKMVNNENLKCFIN